MKRILPTEAVTISPSLLPYGQTHCNSKLTGTNNKHKVGYIPEGSILPADSLRHPCDGTLGCVGYFSCAYKLPKTYDTVKLNMGAPSGICHCSTHFWSRVGSSSACTLSIFHSILASKVGCCNLNPTYRYPSEHSNPVAKMPSFEKDSGANFRYISFLTQRTCHITPNTISNYSAKVYSTICTTDIFSVNIIGTEITDKQSVEPFLAKSAESSVNQPWSMVEKHYYIIEAIFPSNSLSFAFTDSTLNHVSLKASKCLGFVTNPSMKGIVAYSFAAYTPYMRFAQQISVYRNITNRTQKLDIPLTISIKASSYISWELVVCDSHKTEHGGAGNDRMTIPVLGLQSGKCKRDKN